MVFSDNEAALSSKRCLYEARKTTARNRKTQISRNRSIYRAKTYKYIIFKFSKKVRG